MSLDGLYVISTCINSTILRVWSSAEKSVLESLHSALKDTDTTPMQVTCDIAAIITGMVKGNPMGKEASKLLITSYLINSLHVSLSTTTLSVFRSL